MEQISNTSLFSLSIDPVTKTHLSETARWAKFLAIIGFVFLALMLIGGIISIGTMSYLSSNMGGDTAGFGMFAGYGIGFLAFFFIIVAVIVFFPLMFLLRFANHMKAALASNDQQKLNTSFQNLKAYFRFWGIISIIVLAFYAIIFIFGIFGAALR